MDIVYKCHLLVIFTNIEKWHASHFALFLNIRSKNQNKEIDIIVI